MKKCSACGAENFDSILFSIVQGQRGKVYWQRCKKCNSFFSTNKYDYEAEKVYTFNETAYGAETSGIALNDFKERMYNKIASSVRKKIKVPATLLDIGCSYGGFLLRMKKLGYDVEGFDIVTKAVEYVSSKLKIKATQCFSIVGLDPQGIKTYDVISVLDCNYYWADQAKELKEIYQRISDGGVLVMRITDKSKYLAIGYFLQRFSNRLGQKIMRYSVNDHRFSMPLNSYLNLLSLIGFQVERVSSYEAIYSNNTKWYIKLSFLLGSILWLLTNLNFSPGIVIIARKK